MLIKGKYFSKKSKKGFTLVEALCSVFVLAIVFVGVLNAVAFSRQMVFTNNAREKASYKGQLIADEIFATVTGISTDGSEDPVAAISAVVNDMDDPQNTDPDTKIGTVTKVNKLTDPKNCNGKSLIEYTIEAVNESYSDDTDGTVSVHNVTEQGWNITVRVFYKEVGAQDDYKCVDISAFAPYNYIKNS